MTYLPQRARGEMTEGFRPDLGQGAKVAQAPCPGPGEAINIATNDSARLIDLNPARGRQVATGLPYLLVEHQHRGSFARHVPGQETSTICSVPGTPRDETSAPPSPENPYSRVETY